MRKNTKIGILSMQRIYNYGSWLQAYGLKKMIEENQNVEVEFVDYRVAKPVYKNGFKYANYIVQKIKVIIIDIIGSIKPIAKMIPNKDFYQVYRFRHDYWSKLGITRRPNYTPKLDILIVGSDEVFNCLQENVRVGFSKELFGQCNKANMLVSYAASFGDTTYKKINEYEKEDQIRDFLKKFDKVSVRDNNSVNIVSKLIGITPISNMDPVLMYDFSTELNDNTIVQDDKLKKPYMIVYAYSNRLSEKEIKSIKNFAEEKKLLIYGISGYQSFADEMIFDSPLNILKYFKYAKYVVTDTFHGTIFSVINNVSFVTLIRKSVNGSYGNQEKLEDLLNKLELKNRYTYNAEKIVEILAEKIDYHKTNKIISIERKKAKDYLSEVIDGYRNKTL